MKFCLGGIGRWGAWSEWSRCGRDCRQVRRRKCLGSEEQSCPGRSLQLINCSGGTCTDEPMRDQEGERNLYKSVFEKFRNSADDGELAQLARRDGDY